MAAGFSLSVYPYVYKAKYQEQAWSEEYEEKNHFSPEEEEQLSAGEKETLLASRNSFPDLPLINYTSQYGMGSCN